MRNVEDFTDKLMEIIMAVMAFLILLIVLALLIGLLTFLVVEIPMMFYEGGKELHSFFFLTLTVLVIVIVGGWGYKKW